MNESKNKNNTISINKIIFIIIIVLLFPLLFIMNYVFNGEKDINYLENRTNSKFVDINLTNFMDSSFQDKLENILLDQFPCNEDIKKSYLNLINSKVFRDLFTFSDNKRDKIEIKDEIFSIGEDNYLMWQEYGIDLFHINCSNLLSYINEELKDEDTYLYFINESKAIQDKGGKINNEYFDFLKESLKNTKTSQFEIDSLDDYKYYFYKSDHHWNLYGSYQGYKDIINLLFDDEQIVAPNREVKLSDSYCGSFCRLIGYYDSLDTFYIYDYNYPKIKTYINGDLSNYGHEKNYLEKGWELHEDENCYGAVYGGNYGELIFDTENEDKDNILILSFSYINPIAKLIANHFNRTYIVDIRNYYNDIGTEFNIKKYIEENHINKVLFVGDIDTIVTINKWIGEK